jgi:uncharacterized membrane protein SpoIIM required for sporulation
MNSENIIATVFRAIARAHRPILTIALTYAVSVIVGAIMVHSGNKFALDYADGLVGQAQAADPASLALQQNDRLKAALFDFGGNLLLGAVPNTVTGMTIVTPYPLAAFRGWVGGIVSVGTGGDHPSRLSDPGEAFYYLLTLVLQLIPYSLAGGAGVNLGLAAFWPRPFYQGKKWLGFPKEAYLDVFRIYLLVVPLFLVASLWEFLFR